MTKYFAVGDGHKRIAAKDGYRIDFDATETAHVLWKGDRTRAAIHVSVLTVVPEDAADTTVGLRAVADRARANGWALSMVGNDTSIARDPAPRDDGGYLWYSLLAGRGNLVLSVSIRLSVDAVHELENLVSDVSAMAATLQQRGERELFVCALTETDARRVHEATAPFVDPRTGEVLRAVLQSAFERASASDEAATAEAVGIGYGELIRTHLPELSWATIVDQYGVTLGLSNGDGGRIVTYPIDAMAKRFHDRDLDLVDHARRTAEALRDLMASA